ncbi:AAA family ATPase [Pararhodospirillum photometricum]|nr:ATP-binding protein [Pararhodospirillum photometricum]
MSDQTPPVNTGTIAPLTNVALFGSVVTRIVDRQRHLPGIGLFYGFSGYGKTFAARYAANKHRAYYLEVGESWTKAKFLRALLAELGRQPRGTAADMVEQAIEALALNCRPVIVDECDHVIRRGYLETLREVHDKSGSPFALIGEELSPSLIAQRSERFHNRILVSEAAQPMGADDAAVLARLYHPGLTLTPDLLDVLVRASGGRARRVAVNLQKVADEAAVQGWTRVDAALWGGRELYTGAVPGRRRAE